MIRRIVLFALALVLAVAIRASAQEPESETFPIRIDLIEQGDHAEVYRVCGNALRPVGYAEAGAVTTLAFRVVDLYCTEGVLFLNSRTWNTKLPLADLRRRDQKGNLGALLICPDLLQTSYYVYAGSETHQTCDEARAADESG